MSKTPFRKGMLDWISEHGVSDPAGRQPSKAWCEIFQLATPIRAESVVRLVEEHGREEWKLSRDFPCLELPFPVVFVECGSITPPEGAPSRTPFRAGALLRSMTRAENPEMAPDGVDRWIQVEAVAATSERAVVVAPGSLAIPVNEYGAPSSDVFFDDSARAAIRHAKSAPGMRSASDDVVAALVVRGFLEIAAPALLAVSLMHCKNVTLKKEEPPPEAMQKRRLCDRRPALVHHYTLDIQPMREVLRGEGKSQSVGLRRALHACRGHFKDYRKGGGLFGRLKGLFWWDSHARGDAAFGAIDKDYRIQLPEAATCPNPPQTH